MQDLPKDVLMIVAVAAAVAVNPDESEQEQQRAAYDALAELHSGTDRIRLSAFTTDEHERVVNALRTAIA